MCTAGYVTSGVYVFADNTRRRRDVAAGLSVCRRRRVSDVLDLAKDGSVVCESVVCESVAMCDLVWKSRFRCAGYDDHIMQFELEQCTLIPDQVISAYCRLFST